MALTKTTYAMTTGSPGNVLDYGADPTGVADSAAAFNAALTQNSNVYVPAGTYKILSTVTITPGKILTGAGADNICIIEATVGSGNPVFKLGNSNTALNYYPQIANFDIRLNSDNSIGVLLYGTANARVSNIRAMGDVGATATGKIGFQVDGINSAFFNQFDNCYAFKVNIGYDHISTGVGPGQYSTDQIYINCSAIGGGTASTQVGFKFYGNQGIDSVILGGNCEGLDYGLWIDITSLVVFGHRFEANTTDLYSPSAFTENTTIIGCKNINNVIGFPGEQDGYGNNTFFGNNGTFGKDNYMEAVTSMYAPAADKTPLNVQAYSSQTANLVNFKDNAGGTLAAVGPQGQFVAGGAAFGLASKVVFGGTTATTVGAAGGADALPATPLGYLIAYVGTTPVRIPYYSAP